MPRTQGTKRRANGTGRVYKQNGVYYLQYRLPNGTRKSVTLKDEKGEKLTDLRKAETAARKYLEPFRKINEIDNRLEYLEEKAKLNQFAARTTILLDDAFERYLAKPRPKSMGKFTLTINRGRWNDFVLFVKQQYHLTHLAEVKADHADAYISYLRDHGVYGRNLTEPAKKYKQKKICATTVNKYLRICRCVFRMLLPDLGFMASENPFGHIAGTRSKAENREIFTPDELQLIFSNPPPLIHAMFTIGLCTGLREGDVATLHWDEIDGYGENLNPDDILYREIHRVTRKTNTLVHIPVTEDLTACLNKLYQEKEAGNPYVIPEVARLYLHRAKSLSDKIGQYLNSLGIQTTRKPATERNQSIKDFHSLRHCFCYYAGLKGVPLPVIQSIVGHLSSDMTKHYQQHADKVARQKGMLMMSGLLQIDDSVSTIRTLRQRLCQLAQDEPEEFIVKMNLYADQLLQEKKIGNNPQKFIVENTSEKKSLNVP